MSPTPLYSVMAVLKTVLALKGIVPLLIGVGGMAGFVPVVVDVDAVAAALVFVALDDVPLVSVEAPAKATTAGTAAEGAEAEAGGKIEAVRFLVPLGRPFGNVSHPLPKFPMTVLHLSPAILANAMISSNSLCPSSPSRIPSLSPPPIPFILNSPHFFLPDFFFS